MRTALLYLPALICAGSMIVCVRMMMRGHHDQPHDSHPADQPVESHDEEHVS